MLVKATALLILLVPALAVSYYFAIALPENERARLAFEKSKYEDDKAEKQKREAREGIQATDRKYAFERCVRQAEARYQQYLELNGKTTPEKPNAILTPHHITDRADKHKKDDVEECHRLHGR
jgi:hypothetical protein